MRAKASLTRAAKRAAVGDVAVAGDGDVVIAGVVDARIAVLVDGDFDGAGAGAQGVQVSRRIEVVVKINDGHASSGRQAILTRRSAGRWRPGGGRRQSGWR